MVMTKQISPEVTYHATTNHLWPDVTWTLWSVWTEATTSGKNPLLEVYHLLPKFTSCGNYNHHLVEVTFYDYNQPPFNRSQFLWWNPTLFPQKSPPMVMMITFQQVIVYGDIWPKILFTRSNVITITVKGLSLRQKGNGQNGFCTHSALCPSNADEHGDSDGVGKCKQTLIPSIKGLLSLW